MEIASSLRQSIMCGVRHVFYAPSDNLVLKPSSQTWLSRTRLVSETDFGNNVWRHGLKFILQNSYTSVLHMSDQITSGNASGLFFWRTFN